MKIIFFVLVAALSSNSSSRAFGAESKPLGNFGSRAHAESLISELEYMAALETADDSTFRADFEPYFLLILSQDQKELYERQDSLDERKAFIVHYWNASNPNPLAEENDWLLDFIKRTYYALKHFPQRKPPFIDDRGEIYIRYGKPKFSFEEPGFLAPKFQYPYHANESWSYDNITENFIIHFVKKGQSYRRVENIAEAFEKGGVAPIHSFPFWLTLMYPRRHLSHDLNVTINNLRRGDGGAQPYIKMEVIERDIKEANQRAPLIAYDPQRIKNKLKFVHRISQFRGPNGKTRIDVAVLTKLKKNLLKNVRASSPDTVIVETEGMLRDANFNEILQNDNEKILPVSTTARAGLPNFVSKISLLAFSQPAELTLQVSEDRRDRIGYFRQALDVRDFSGDSLMLSDLRLDFLVEKAKHRPVLSPVQLEGMTTSPYPFDEIRRGRSPMLYFEIYNTSKAGEELAISCTIIPVKVEGGEVIKGDASVNIRYERPVEGDVMHELIELNLGGVAKGRHLLEVMVSSRQDAQIVASAKKVLEIGK